MVYTRIFPIVQERVFRSRVESMTIKESGVLARDHAEKLLFFSVSSIGATMPYCILPAICLVADGMLISREIGKGFGQAYSILFLHDTSTGSSDPALDMVYA